MKLTFVYRVCFFLMVTWIACRSSPSEKEASTVRSVTDAVVTRLYDQLTPQELDTISENFIAGFLTDSEKHVLASEYWKFDVNQPVTVSLMRHQDQKSVPFWMEQSGFRNTGKLVKNESYTYEVWQKDFDTGRVHLGINGFDKHRPVYFVTVAPKDKKGKTLTITNVYPRNQHFEKCNVGAFTYHDWDELRLTEIPEALKGQVLLTTIRGRAREAHLIGAFRKTPHPSTRHPDQIMLTWSGDPKTTIDVQWRVNNTVRTGAVKYWILGAKDTNTVSAIPFLMEDRLLQNDRFVYRFTSKLNGLRPGQIYHYKVGSPVGGWSTESNFRTASLDADSFSFIWFGDTHYSPHFGDMAKKTLERHPETAFYQIAGDLVTTGLHRDDWDQLFHHSGQVFSSKPLMPVPGNHDSQDGLGAWMYKEMFSLPENGPEKIPTEMTYAYQYKNALFLMIDATQPIDAQTAWIEKQLQGSKARWKFAMFHFPPYNFEEDYAEIRKKWCSLFDKYHVDMVMSGHVHYYMRTKPMFNEKPVANPSEGTIYTVSISIPAEHEVWPEERYALVRHKSGPLYQHLSIDGNSLVYRSMDSTGRVVDQFKISK